MGTMAEPRPKRDVKLDPRMVFVKGIPASADLAKVEELFSEVCGLERQLERYFQDTYL